MTNARIAGWTFLVYIAAGLTSFAVFGRVTAGATMALKLAGIAGHPAAVGVVLVLGLVQAFCALVLAVTLYSITRAEGPDVALLGLVCRVTEGVIVGLSVADTQSLRWLATAGGATAPEPAAAHALAAYLLSGSAAVTTTFFAVGSTCFAWLLLRGRLIPAPLAWLGVAASVLLVAGLPLELVDVIGSPVTTIMVLPMLVFEVSLGLWFIVKGVARPARG
jgi:hypothetical protein